MPVHFYPCLSKFTSLFNGVYSEFNLSIPLTDQSLWFSTKKPTICLRLTIKVAIGPLYWSTLNKAQSTHTKCANAIFSQISKLRFTMDVLISTVGNHIKSLCPGAVPRSVRGRCTTPNILAYYTNFQLIKKFLWNWPLQVPWMNFFS